MRGPHTSRVRDNDLGMFLDHLRIAKRTGRPSKTIPVSGVCTDLYDSATGPTTSQTVGAAGSTMDEDLEAGGVLQPAQVLMDSGISGTRDGFGMQPVFIQVAQCWATTTTPKHVGHV